MNNAKAGIGLNVGQDTNQTYTAAPMPEPLYAINNTFVGNDAGISGGANLVAINNIFSQQNSFDLKNVSGNSTIKNTLFAVTPHLVGSNNIDNATTYQGNPMLDSNYLLSPGSPAIDKGLASFQHSYSYDGSGGGSAQTYTEYAINLNSSQYTGPAPDLGWREYGQIGNTPTPTRTPTPGATNTPTPTGNPTPTPTTGAQAARLKFKILLPDISSAVNSIPSSDVQVQLREAGTSTTIAIANTQLVRSGNYFQTAAEASFNISQNKTYTVFVKVNIGLQRSFSNVRLTQNQTLDCTSGSNSNCGDMLTPDNKPLLSGDSDGFNAASGSYNKIDSADLQVLASQFNTQAPTSGPSADFNLDGQVNISDLDILGKNYGKLGD
ncbi:hypothetical protein HY612_05840 [Candidatus Roizmanbacteria bacterium]|nr:hypothetical protein [Candidatus Roizmanbacteria bacterium]